MSIVEVRGRDELTLAISAAIFESSNCKLASTSSIAFFSVCKRSRSFCVDCNRSFPGDLLGLEVGLEVDSVAELFSRLRVGILEVESILACPFLGDSFEVWKGSSTFSFWRDERIVRLLYCEGGLVGILDGGGIRGPELNFSDVCFIWERGCSGSSSRVAASIRLLRSESELRRFLLGVLRKFSSVSGSPIVRAL